MRELVKLDPALTASGHDLADPLRNGTRRSINAALRKWTAQHPNPFAPRSRAAREKLANQTAK